jgi:hypothetical protein
MSAAKEVRIQELAAMFRAGTLTVEYLTAPFHQGDEPEIDWSKIQELAEEFGE